MTFNKNEVKARQIDQKTPKYFPDIIYLTFTYDQNINQMTSFLLRLFLFKKERQRLYAHNLKNLKYCF